MEHAGGKELVQDLVRERDPTIGETRVDEIRLTESTHGRGPVYSTVESFPSSDAGPDRDRPRRSGPVGGGTRFHGTGC